MSTYILAIDQGTSGTKAIIFNSEGKLICKAVSGLKSYYPLPGYVEQSPDEIYSTVLSSVKSCITIFTEQFNGKVEDIVACGISNQRETFVVWNSDGKPLYNAVVWQCKRSTQICKRMSAKSKFNNISEITGLIIDPYFSATKMIWLYENNADIKSAVDKGEAHFGTIDTWLLYKLTNGKSYYTDYTNASRTLFFNLNDLEWDKGLLAKYNLSSLNLPEVKPSSFNFGRSNFNNLLKNEITINGMIGDSHAAAFGEGCFYVGNAKATLGTGSSILMNTGFKRTKSNNGMMSTICWSTEKQITYALEGVIVSNGSTITWLRDQLGLFTNSADTESMAKSVDNSAGVYLIPAFSGIGAPFWKMNAKAIISGLTFGSNKNHIVRAALESIAFQIKSVINAMEKDSNLKLNKLKVDGGMTLNKLVLQMIADLIETEVFNIGIEDVSALGAAYMAGLGIGIYSDINDLTRLNTNNIIYKHNENKKLICSYMTWLEELKKL